MIISFCIVVALGVMPPAPLPGLGPVPTLPGGFLSRPTPGPAYKPLDTEKANTNNNNSVNNKGNPSDTKSVSKSPSKSPKKSPVKNVQLIKSGDQTSQENSSFDSSDIIYQC